MTGHHTAETRAQMRASHLAKFPPLRERLLERISPEPNTGCWLWTGVLRNTGYGELSFQKKKLLAHRASYEIFIGPIPDGLCLDHLCRQRSCINPDHLEAVSMRTNLLRGVGVGAVNAVKTHCPKGHPLADAYHYRGERHCAECCQIRSKEYFKRVGKERRRARRQQQDG